MPRKLESEWAKDLDNLITRADKFVQNLKRDTADVLVALKKLRDRLPEKGGNDAEEKDS